MGVEIERKYLVKNTDYRQKSTKHEEICQGYLSRNPESTVRVRIKGERGFITVKGLTEGASRSEWEYEIPLADARQMLRLAEGRVIEKVRYYVENDGLMWEVDEFGDDLQGLVMAEVELPTEDADYSLPDFVGEEVTGDPRYYNSNL